MHHYQDDWPHWKELFDALAYIEAYVYKWSWCRLMAKEKWGMLRYERVLPPCKGCGLTIYGPWKVKRPWTKEKERPIIYMWSASWLYFKWVRFGEWVLSKAVKKACILFPNVVKEITHDINL